MVTVDVTVIIPTIPPRRERLARAVDSVLKGAVQPKSIMVEIDNDHLGSAKTRNRALRKVETEWVAFLDDDDEWLPHHLNVLMHYASIVEGDVFYSGCDVFDAAGNIVPRQEEWGRFGLPFDPDLLRQRSYIPVTSLVRTDIAQRSQFNITQDSPLYDDWNFYKKILENGGNFVHVAVVTWRWHHWGGNTSGRGDRW